jgi:hypothetical protein
MSARSDTRPPFRTRLLHDSARVAPSTGIALRARAAYAAGMGREARIAGLALLLCAAVAPHRARGAEEEDVVTVVPGESRVISHATSASRDTGLLSYQVLPRVVLSTGGDFALLGFRFCGLELRAGMFGLIEVETKEAQPASFMNVPGGTYLWRGLLGYSLALSLGDLGERLLGDRGQMELAVSFRHESEHYTGSREGGEPLFPEVPNVGDFVMPDLALRKALGPLDVELRFQVKAFLPTTDRYAYSAGPGGDLVVRWRALSLMHPFLSVFAERMIGREVGTGDARRRIPDDYTVRGLLGLIVPGEAADLMLYAAGSVGNGKGLLAFLSYREIGWGIRVAFLKRSPFAH